ncbi:hypothetical protein [Planctomycetes bacterium Pan216]|uniref:hypothetical protein n=1 Tax=Kolteria novifilia TaxID=2527975 RepID=UPI0011A4A0BD
MSRFASMITLAVLCLATALTDDLRAEPSPAAEGRLPSGEMRRGTVRKSGLSTDGKPASLDSARGTDPLSSFRQVTLLPGARSVRLRSQPLLVDWGDAGGLLTRSLAIDNALVRFQSTLGPVELPKRTLRSVLTYFKGEVTLEDPFSTIGPSWNRKGGVDVRTQRYGTPPSALPLTVPGQRLWREFDEPIARGSIRFLFFDDSRRFRHRRWYVAVTFGSSPRPQLRIEPGWDRDFYTVSAGPLLELETQAIPRTVGWKEIVIDFGSDGMVITLDDQLLAWRHRSKELPPLSRLEFGTDDGPDDEDAEAWIDDLRIITKWPERTTLLSDPHRTMVATGTGDAWFGTLESADEEAVTLAGAERKRFDWNDISRLVLPDSAEPTPLVWEGEIGLLRLRDGSRLIATLLDADESSWTIDHPLLGRRTVALEHLDSWKPLLVGRRTLFYPRSFHLGEKVVTSFDRPVPDGSRLRASFQHEAKPGTAWLTFRWNLKDSPLSAPRMLPGNFGLWVNGQSLGKLSSLARVDDGLARIALPEQVLHAGINSLEFMPLVAGDLEEVEFSGLALELESREDATP